MITIVNLNNFPVSPKVNGPFGSTFVHIQAKGKATLDEGLTVDSNWAATATKIRIIDSAAQAPVVAQA
jgi:hypothetical protein